MAARKKKLKHKSRRQERKAAKQRVQRVRPGRASTRPLNWFKHEYGRDFLVGAGPLLWATWELPPPLQERFRAEGRAVPAAVRGVLLLDTGASHTCISLKAADSLGLQATRVQSSYGSGGFVRNPMFFAKLTISMTDGQRQTAIFWEMEVQGIRDLEKPFEAMQIRIGGESVELVGLLGRDILRHTRIEYDGPSGKMKIRFDLDSLHAGAQEIT